jgi:hypothetical protein
MEQDVRAVNLFFAWLELRIKMIVGCHHPVSAARAALVCTRTLMARALANHGRLAPVSLFFEALHRRVKEPAVLVLLASIRTRLLGSVSRVGLVARAKSALDALQKMDVENVKRAHRAAIRQTL